MKTEKPESRDQFAIKFTNKVGGRQLTSNSKRFKKIPRKL